MLGIWLLLIMYRKSYEGIPLVILDLTYDDLEISNQGHMTLKCKIKVMETVHVRHIVTV